jgi:flagellin
MMTVINTNTAAINAQYNLNKVQSAMDDAMSALSSGKRVTSAADDAAGLSIITRMESQVRGLNQAMKNAADGQNMVATAEGAMDEITNMLQRMRELALQAANDTMNQQDRNNLNNEMDQLKIEIDRVVDNTRFNDQVLLDGTQQGTSLQIGAKSGESMSFNIADMSTSSLGSNSSALDAVGSTSASAQGTAAVENVVNMTFNGNGTYAFNITLDGKSATGGTQEQISISADVNSYSAKDVAQDINDKIALTAASGYAERDLTGILSATYSGNTVTITNKEGTSVDIGSFVAQGSNTAIVNPVTNAGVDTKTLESVTEINTLANSGGDTAVASKATLQLQIGKKFSFELNNTLIEVDTTTDGLAAAGKTLPQALTALDDAITDAIDLTSGTGKGSVTVTNQGGTHMTIEMQDATGANINVSAFDKQSVRAVDDSFITFNADVTGTTTATVAHGEALTADLSVGGTASTIATTKTGRISFGNQELANSFSIDWTAGSVNGVVATAASTYTVDVTKDFNDELDRIANEISADGGLNVTAVNNGGSLEINNQSTGAITFATTAISAEGFAAVTEGTAHIWSDVLASEAVTDDDNISDETGASSLVDGSVYHVTNGTEAVASVMALTFDSDDRYSFQIQGTANANITADVANGSLTALMNVVNSHSSTTDVTASIDNGSLILSKADGSAFTIANFSSEANGKATAANAAGQGGSALLEDAGTAASMAIGASGAAVSTTAELSFSADDKYSFKISDGASTATVRATDTVDGSDADADTADLLAEITLALSSANMSHIKATSATGDNGTITLTNELGGKIDISNFASDSSGKMTVSPASGQGVAKILDDDAVTGSYDSVASIDALSASTAQSAVQAIDRALENINSQRSELGAVSNRLDHTISNLGNVAMNTEASQSRIEDADFATETSNLTKAQILSQAATAMLAQANASKQSVLSLLQ